MTHKLFNKQAASLALAPLPLLLSYSAADSSRFSRMIGKMRCNSTG